MIYEGQAVSDRKSGHMSGLVLEIICMHVIAAALLVVQKLHGIL
jgi:hypothetical protein